MPSTNALSCTPYVKEWLTHSQHPRILHVFEHACNLVNERREVLSIVPLQIGDGPFNLVIADDLSFSDELSLESPIFISPEQLTLGNFYILTGSAISWNPLPEWKILHTRRNHILTQLAVLTPTNYQSSTSLASALASAVVDADISSARDVASRLAGLGAGLTPAGDDFLMGAIYAAWIIHPTQTASVLAEEIANTAAPLTTSLSAAWLRSAAKGEAGILWHEFLAALALKDRMHMEEAVKSILAVGETSGADAMAGFATVCASWIENVGHSYG